MGRGVIEGLQSVEMGGRVVKESQLAKGGPEFRRDRRCVRYGVQCVLVGGWRDPNVYNRRVEVRELLTYANWVLAVEGPSVLTGDKVVRGTRRCANRVRV